MPRRTSFEVFLYRMLLGELSHRRSVCRCLIRSRIKNVRRSKLCLLAARLITNLPLSSEWLISSMLIRRWDARTRALTGGGGEEEEARRRGRQKGAVNPHPTTRRLFNYCQKRDSILPGVAARRRSPKLTPLNWRKFIYRREVYRHLMKISRCLLSGRIAINSTTNAPHLERSRNVVSLFILFLRVQQSWIRLFEPERKSGLDCLFEHVSFSTLTRETID